MHLHTINAITTVAVIATTPKANQFDSNDLKSLTILIDIFPQPHMFLFDQHLQSAFFVFVALQ